MITLTQTRHKTLSSAIASVLAPHERAMVCGLIEAENPGRPAAQAEEMMYWMRLNMPVAARRVEDILHPFPFAD